MDNAAFDAHGDESGANGHETARILRRLANEIETEEKLTEDYSTWLRDINGNKVGKAFAQ